MRDAFFNEDKGEVIILIPLPSSLRGWELAFKSGKTIYNHQVPTNKPCWFILFLNRIVETFNSRLYSWGKRRRSTSLWSVKWVSFHYKLLTFFPFYHVCLPLSWSPVRCSQPPLDPSGLLRIILHDPCRGFLQLCLPCIFKWWTGQTWKDPTSWKCQRPKAHRFIHLLFSEEPAVGVIKVLTWDHPEICFPIMCEHAEAIVLCRLKAAELQHSAPFR